MANILYIDLTLDVSQDEMSTLRSREQRQNMLAMLVTFEVSHPQLATSTEVIPEQLSKREPIVVTDDVSHPQLATSSEVMLEHP